MSNEHMKTWLDQPVAVYDVDRSESPVTAEQVSKTIFRITLEDYDSPLSMAELFERFLANPAVAGVEALILGNWNGEGAGGDTSADSVVELLVGARSALPNLKAIFYGDIISEECEVSWIQHTDLAPLFLAYPNLEHFGIRGTVGLSLGTPLDLPHLKSLSIQTGGMPLTVFEEATSGNLPNLEKLELWLGTDAYEGEICAQACAELLSGESFPKLKHLWLCNSDDQDDVAQAAMASPLLLRLETLGLGMGTLSDVGGQALLDSPAARNLKHLDLHYHFLTDEMVVKLRAAFPSIDLTEQQAADEYGPFVAVGE